MVPAAIVFYVAGLERKFVAAALATGMVFSVAFVASKPYRMARIIGFFDPEYKLIGRFDPEGRIKKYVSESVTTRDAGYQVRQSKIAVGSGGVFGLGLMQGRQKILLPAGGAHGFYLRSDRRGARIVRLRRRAARDSSLFSGEASSLLGGCRMISAATWRWASPPPS